MSTHESTRGDLRLDPTIARTDKGRFVLEAVQTLHEQGRYSGNVLSYVLSVAPQIWHYPGGRSVDIDIRPDTWASSSNVSNGTIMLGAGQIGEEGADRLHFLSGQFDYTKSVAYRLSHEVHHYVDAIAYVQNTQPWQVLDAMTRAVREENGGQRGLSALGSMDFYRQRGGVAEMAGEDRTELLTMYSWDPEYFKRFAHFLADPAQELERQRVGLATIQSSDIEVLSDTVALIVHDAIGRTNG